MWKLKSLNQQNIYVICKDMIFSTHIDVFKSCLGPLLCHLRYIFKYTLKIIDILLKSLTWQNFQKVFKFRIACI